MSEWMVKTLVKKIKHSYRIKNNLIIDLENKIKIPKNDKEFFEINKSDK